MGPPKYFCYTGHKTQEIQKIRAHSSVRFVSTRWQMSKVASEFELCYVLQFIDTLTF
jgi:hypothetical protein